MGRRTERVHLCVHSGHVLSETAGAQLLRGKRLIPIARWRAGASIDGEDRVLRIRPGLSADHAVRTFCPAPGVLARLRGQAQVVAALDSVAGIARRGMCNRRVFMDLKPADRRQSTRG